MRRIAAAAALACATAACSDGSGPGLTPGLHLAGGGTGSDTIEAILVRPLAVRLVDDDGQPLPGREVVFLSPDGTARVANVGDVFFAPWRVATTDADGNASVRVQLGWRAGEALVEARVLTETMDDTVTARYTVTPGAAAKIGFTPQDTAVHVGATYALRAFVTDRADNERDDPPPALSLVHGPATFAAGAGTGTVTTTAFGRLAVRAVAGAVDDTAWATVVPEAWVATQQHDPGNGGPLGVFLMRLDGTGRTRITGGVENAWAVGQGFGWSPDGRSLAIARNDSVGIVSPGSAERRILAGDGFIGIGARYSSDGRWIWFARSGRGIYRVHPDGTGEERVGPGGNDLLPSPSPDGLRVAYGSYSLSCTSDPCIRVYDLGSGEERMLVPGVHSAWSPLGTTIAYASEREVGLIAPDGSNRRVLITNPGHIGWLDWSPDGRWLLVARAMGPVTLIDTTDGTILPVPTLRNYGATAWRPATVAPAR